jgi:hypothetical protein
VAPAAFAYGFEERRVPEVANVRRSSGRIHPTEHRQDIGNVIDKREQSSDCAPQHERIAIAGIADRGAVDRNMSRQDQRLVARERELREGRCQDAIESCPVFLGGNRQFLALRPTGRLRFATEP